MDTWSTNHLSQETSEPAYYIVDWRISKMFGSSYFVMALVGILSWLKYLSRDIYTYFQISDIYTSYARFWIETNSTLWNFCCLYDTREMKVKEICYKNGGPKYKLAPPENILSHFSMPHCVYTEAEKTRITLLSSISFLQLFTATSCFVLTLLCLGLSSTILIQV